MVRKGHLSYLIALCDMVTGRKLHQHMFC